MKKYGVLLVNLGTPDSPEKAAVRAYLREFLMDKRVINLAWPLRFFLVNFIIVPKRLKAVTELYQSIWEQDSPIRLISYEQVQALESLLNEDSEVDYYVQLGMTYGKPSIQDALEALQNKNVDELVTLPLYPQFSDTTTTPVKERLEQAIKALNFEKKSNFVSNYYQNPLYIEAIRREITKFWHNSNTPEVLLLSYHGIPKSYTEAGDPYVKECKETTRMIKKALESTGVEIRESFQSRVTSEEWTKPYTDDVLRELGQSGTERVHVFCPGFAADCLETLDEIAVEYKELFLDAGGLDFECLPALNDADCHIQMMGNIVKNAL